MPVLPAADTLQRVGGSFEWVRGLLTNDPPTFAWELKSGGNFCFWFFFSVSAQAQLCSQSFCHAQ